MRPQLLGHRPRSATRALSPSRLLFPSKCWEGRHPSAGAPVFLPPEDPAFPTLPCLWSRPGMLGAQSGPGPHLDHSEIHPAPEEVEPDTKPLCRRQNLWALLGVVHVGGLSFWRHPANVTLRTPFKIILAGIPRLTPQLGH